MCEIDGFQLVIDPIGELAEIVPAPGAGMRLPGGLADSRIGVVDNRMTGMRPLAAAIERALVVDFDVARVDYWEVPHSIAPDPAVMRAIVEGCDAAIIGLGNCGACTTWECRVSAELRRSIPTIDVVTEPFEPVARAGFRGLGLAFQPLVVLAASAESASAAEIEGFADEVARECAANLVAEGAA
jgi:hypothetical protein